MKYTKLLTTLALIIILPLLMVAVTATPAMALAGTIYASSTSGPVGTPVSIQGSGFTANQNYTVYFGAVSVTSGYTGAGAFYVTFNVPPSPKGYYNITVTTTALDTSNTTSFLVTPEITLNASSGYVGGAVTVSGTGFAASKNVSISFDNVNVGTTVSTDTKGSFVNATFTTPESSRGSHTVKATDASNNYATSSFTTTQSTAITPTSGAVNDDVTVSGTGFRASQSITITYDDAVVATNPASVTTASNGSFSATFNVPAGASGTHTVKVSDGSYTASASFTAATSFSLSQTTGHADTEVTVSGTGFRASQSITITFNNIQVKNITTDATGSFSGTFIVPPSSSGTYQVTASDGTNIATTDFTISVSASLSQTTGNVGTEQTVSGVGFRGTISIKYDDTEVATTTADANGAFSTTFKIPVSIGGEHTITVSDGINTLQSNFTMESEAPPIPRPLLPNMGVKAKAETHFDWEDVTDPSGVTYTLQVASDADFTSIVLEKKEITASEYTLTKEQKLASTSKEAPYYWRIRATDGASNESGWTDAGTFYIGFSFTMPSWTLYALIGFGALLLFFLGLWVGRRTAYSY